MYHSGNASPSQSPSTPVLKTVRCLSQGTAKEDVVLNMGQGETSLWSPFSGLLEAGLMRNSIGVSPGKGSVSRFTQSMDGD